MKCGILLSGCGFADGSEIHEAVFCMHSLQKAGLELIPLSLNQKQKSVMNHLSERMVTESRNTMEESARISRGKLFDLAQYDFSLLDMLVIPGGTGCIKNLSDFSEKLKELTVVPEVEKLIRHCHQKEKPIGAVCIAPVLLAKVLGEFGPSLTVGNNNEVEACLNSLGARMFKCDEGHYLLDKKNKLGTSPAYMYGESSLVNVQKGIDAMVGALLQLN